MEWMMNKAYLRMLLTQYLPALILLLLVTTMFALTPHLSPVYSTELIGEAQYYCNEGTTLAMEISILIAVILPMMLFSYIHRKSSVDMYFALPVSRKKLLITGIFFAWMTAWGCFLVSSFVVYIRYAALLSPAGWFLKVLWAAVGLLVVTITVTLVYAFGNNLFDGLVLVCAYAAIPLAVLWALAAMFRALVAGDPDAIVGQIARCLSPLYLCYAGVAGSAGVAGNASETGTAVLYLVILLIFGAVSCFGLKREFIDRKTERAGQISDGFFAYPLIIQVYLALTMMCIVFTFYHGEDYGTAVVFLLILFVIFIIAMAVYRRRIRIRWQDILEFGIMFLCCLVLSLIGWKTEGFGLARGYSLTDGDTLVYEYYADVTRESIDTLADDNYDWEKGLTVRVSLMVPSDPSERKIAAAQAVELLESRRKDIITDFYHSPDDYDPYQNTYASLLVFNAELGKKAGQLSDTGEIDKRFDLYYYTIQGQKHVLTKEDLQTLQKAGAEISITDYNGNEVYKDIDQIPD